MEKLTRAQELMFSGAADDIRMESVFGEALDLLIQEHCPKEKLKRREARIARKREKEFKESQKVENINKLEAVEEFVRDEVTEEESVTAAEVKISDSTEVAVTENIKARTRYIPAELRERVLRRDNYQCSYVSPTTGIRCSCRVDLEMQHVVPFAMGGETTFDNLTTHCQPHNLNEARKVFGEQFIEAKIQGS